MPDPITSLSKLRRPSILVRAAHLGLDHYNRERTLQRLLPGKLSAATTHSLELLRLLEVTLENQRLDGEASYSVAKHVECLAALIFEARLMMRHGG